MYQALLHIMDTRKHKATIAEGIGLFGGGSIYLLNSLTLAKIIVEFFKIIGYKNASVNIIENVFNILGLIFSLSGITLLTIGLIGYCVVLILNVFNSINQ